jgi:hypothetical protein
MLAEEAFGVDATRREAVTCLACSGIHFLDPVRGEVLGGRGSAS